MKKLLPILLISIFLFSCKSNEEPKPTTLADRAGTYEGSGYTLIIKSSGEVQIVDTEKLSHKTTLDKANTATSFDVDSFKIDLSNGVKINTAELTRKSDSQTFLLTLEERAGTYTCSDTIDGSTIISIVIKIDGSLNIDNASFPQLKANSTETILTVKEAPKRNNEWIIDFNNNQIKQTLGGNLTYNITKN